MVNMRVTREEDEADFVPRKLLFLRQLSGRSLAALAPCSNGVHAQRPPARPTGPPRQRSRPCSLRSLCMRHNLGTLPGLRSRAVNICEHLKAWLDQE